MMTDIIPIDSSIKDFKDYLLAHPRTIFSAGFGEGKSFFLFEFQKECNDVFEFITLYPVNYQVAANQDIFNLIKRDVLCQLFFKGIIQPSYPITKSVALSFFLTNPDNYLKQLTEWVCELDYPSPIANTLIKPMVKFFKQMKDQFEVYCQEKIIPKGERDFEKLYNSLEEEGIYECDAITQLIQDGISNWKKNNSEKKIVLLVEDLDRIDPAHIFRILNVLSAHIDYGYKFLNPVSKLDISGNKFGFDNIICVVDHKNLQNIYHHFYGPRTSWDGYIEKFSSNGFFEYSLSALKYEHFISLISEHCGLSHDIIRLFVSKELLIDQTLRSLNNCMVNLSEQIREIKPYNGNETLWRFPKEFLMLIVILQRLGKSKGEIGNQILEIVKKEDNLKKFILPFFYTKYSYDIRLIYLGEKDNMNYDLVYSIDEPTTSKPFRFHQLRHGGTNISQKETLATLISHMLTYIKVG